MKFVTASSQRKERTVLLVGVLEDLGQKGGGGILKVVIVSLLYLFLEFQGFVISLI